MYVNKKIRKKEQIFVNYLEIYLLFPVYQNNVLLWNNLVTNSTTVRKACNI